MPEKPPILVVEGEDELRELLLSALKVDGYIALGARDGEAALELMAREAVSVVVADLFVKGINGLELLKRARERWAEVEVVITARDAPIHSVVKVMKSGAFDFVPKPIDREYFLLVVGKAVAQVRLAHENQALRRMSDLRGQRSPELTASSPAMREVVKTIELVAPTDLTVLIEGESGVGKELVANSLHQKSPRRAAPFIAINCGVLQETLLESELFGHEKGAFTGAHADHQGLFEIADGGTLFLDEIGEMGTDLQVKLLRVLETSEFRRVGGHKQIHVDVRLVAATNKKLQDEVRGGRFREDLFYRLNVMHIEVPPLRDRKDEIPELVRGFLRAHARRGLPEKRMSDETLEALKSYRWPGNVRELKNLVERSVILARSEVITPRDLPPTLFEPDAAPPVEDDGDTALASVEQRHIMKVLRRQNGNKVRAAKVLGINVKTLYNKIKAYESKIAPK
ncbi:sigma-54-dependent Fis family transcriptional regulator [bacterium]|nr:sigma-54-dependent Fis family transcriptional regulator [bacterium]